MKGIILSFAKNCLVLIILLSFVHAKEIKTDSVNTEQILIKIATLNSQENSVKIIKKLNILGFDTLTLEHEIYELYTANIKVEDYEKSLTTIHKYFPSAYRSRKKQFTTQGVFLLSEEEAIKFEDSNTTAEDINISLPNNAIKNITIDSNETNISIEKNLLDKNTLLKDKNTKQTIVKTIIKDSNSNASQQKEENTYLKSSNFSKDEKLKSPQVKIDLIDAVLQALSISYSVKASKEKLIQAKRNIDIAYGDYLPSVNVAYTIAKNDERPGDYTPEQIYEKANYYTDESYSISLSQNIYAGGETQNEIKRLEAQYRVAQTDFKRLLEEETLKAITSYIDVVFTRESKEVNQKNMEVLSTIFEIVKAKYDAGALSIGELSNIEASVSNAKSQLSKTNSKFNNAMEYFKFITGELFQQTYPHEKIVHVEVDPLEEILENIPKKNTSIISYGYTIQSKKSSLDKIKSSFRPSVDLLLSAEKVTDQDNYEWDEDTYTAQLSVNYNLYNGNKDKNLYLKTFSSIQEIIYERERESRKIKWELEKLHTSLTSLQDNLENVEDEVSSSAKMVSSYWESFRNGEQDLPVLLQGQRQLNTAELSYIQSQQDSMKDYFEILKISGDILDYFKIDINEKNYLDMARAKFRRDKLPQEEVTSIISPTSPIKKEDINTTIESLKQDNNETVMMKLLSFHEKFLMENEEKFTISFDNFRNPIDGLKKISNLKITNDSFIYEYFDDQKIKTKIAYGIFDSQEDAQLALNQIFLNEHQQDLKVMNIKDVQEEFKKFSTISFINIDNIPKIEPEIKIVKEIEKPFETDPAFKDKFLNSPKDYFTINITSLSSMKTAGKVVKDEGIELNSFVFAFGYKKDWYKLMYGVYQTYEEAKKALESLKLLSTMYMPIIEKVDLKQKLYKKFNEK